MKKDPSKQQHHTFGTSPAAVRLKKEIDKPDCNYRAAVRILNHGMRTIWQICHPSHPARTNRDRQYLLGLLRKDIVTRIMACGSDLFVRSLCRNVFITKMRSVIKL